MSPEEINQWKQVSTDFFNKVKVKFQDDKKKFTVFVTLVNDFKAKRINGTCFIARMKHLLVRHRDLISAFNNFFPFKVRMSWTDEISEAARILNMLKTRFQRDHHVCKLFTRLLTTRNQTLIQEIAALLEDQGELHEEFTHYIKETS